MIIDHTPEDDGSCMHLAYVGKANRPSQRWKAHLRSASSNNPKSYISRAMKLRGIQNFEFFVVSETQTEDEAYELERKLIHELRTYVGYDDCAGYNLTLGGEGVDSEVMKKIMRDCWADPEFYEKRSLSNKNRWKDPLERQRHSEKLRLVSDLREVRENRSKAMKNRWLDESYRSHMSSLCQERWKNADFRLSTTQKISAAKSTPEERDRLSKRNSDHWAKMSPEQRKTVLDKMQLGRLRSRKIKEKVLKEPKAFGPSAEIASMTWKNDEVRKRRIEGMKRAWITRREKDAASKVHVKVDEEGHGPR
jgi:hypothetical protein